VSARSLQDTTPKCPVTLNDKEKLRKFKRESLEKETKEKVYFNRWEIYKKKLIIRMNENIVWFVVNVWEGYHKLSFLQRPIEWG